jgi:transposase
MRYALRNAEWKLIQPNLLCEPRGIPRVDDWRILNSIFWVLRSSAPWRDFPECNGHTPLATTASSALCLCPNAGYDNRPSSSARIVWEKNTGN